MQVQAAPGLLLARGLEGLHSGPTEGRPGAGWMHLLRADSSLAMLPPASAIRRLSSLEGSAGLGLEDVTHLTYWPASHQRKAPSAFQVLPKEACSNPPWTLGHLHPHPVPTHCMPGTSEVSSGKALGERLLEGREG